MREKIARTDLRTEQTVQLATDIKGSTTRIEADITRNQADTTNIKGDTTRIQEDTTRIKEDSAASRTNIERLEANQAAFAKLIRKMQRSVQTLLQDSSRNRECTSTRAHTT